MKLGNKSIYDFLLRFQTFFLTVSQPLFQILPPASLDLANASLQSLIPGVILLERKLAKYSSTSFISALVHFILVTPMWQGRSQTRDKTIIWWNECEVKIIWFNMYVNLIPGNFHICSSFAFNSSSTCTFLSIKVLHNIHRKQITNAYNYTVCFNCYILQFRAVSLRMMSKSNFLYSEKGFFQKTIIWHPENEAVGKSH